MPNPTPTRRIRLFFLIGSLEIGGSETQLVELASRLNRSLFDVTVCSMTDGGALLQTLERRGVRVIGLGFTGIRNAPTIGDRLRGAFNACRGTLRLWWLLVRERPDVLHGILMTAYVAAAFVGRAAGVRRIVASRRSLGGFKEGRPFALMLERWADGMTDVFIANSDAVRRDTLLREPIEPDSIVVIRNGVDFSRFQVEADRVPSPAPRVIVVANLIRYKGHEFFLAAWREVLKRFPQAAASIVGEGPERAHLERLTHELGLAGSVEFLGRRRDVEALLSNADVYVQPSLQEGSSNAVLEAMAAGLPVIVTAVGGNSEAVSDGVTGVLVPPSDSAALGRAMLELLSDAPRAQALGRRARQAVHERHDMTAMVQAFEAVYRRVASVGLPNAQLGNVQVHH
jgi:glycosyltransferase involved in cell wall biosynthesis